MTDLQNLFNLQEDLQTSSYGARPQDLSEKEQIQFIKDTVLAAEDELHELLGEVSWKPWQSAQYINVEAYKGELVDLFHFVMNLALVVGMDAEDLALRYIKKREKNIKRQIDGYDGVSTKCPGCKRALDDDAVKCGEDTDDRGAYFWCDQIEGVIDPVTGEAQYS